MGNTSNDDDNDGGRSATTAYKKRADSRSPMGRKPASTAIRAAAGKLKMAPVGCSR